MADAPHRPRHVELLPPESPTRRQEPATRTDNGLPSRWETDNWLPSSLMRRVLNKVITKEAESYAGRVAAVNNVIALCTQNLQLREEFAVRLARFEALPLMKRAAEAQVYAEVRQIFADADRVFEDIDDQKDERTLQRIKRKADLIRAQRELDDLQRVPAPALPPPPKESRANQKAVAIKRIREECDQLIAVLLAGRREEELDEDDRQLVDECRLNAMRRIKELLRED